VRIRGRYIGHICLFDRTCWRHYFELGTPMRIYIGDRFWTVLANTKRSERIWDLDNPVHLERDSEGRVIRAVYRGRREG
jgi:hypothetical protein